jgi:hypothetical protein
LAQESIVIRRTAERRKRGSVGNYDVERVVVVDGRRNHMKESLIFNRERDGGGQGREERQDGVQLEVTR